MSRRISSLLTNGAEHEHEHDATAEPHSLRTVLSSASDPDLRLRHDVARRMYAVMRDPTWQKTIEDARKYE